MKRLALFVLLLCPTLFGTTLTEGCRVVGRLAAGSPSQIRAWSVAQGNLSVAPEQLLPGDVLSRMGARGPLTVRIEQVAMPSHPGIPPGLRGEKISLFAGGEQVLSVTLGNDPKSPAIFYLADFELAGLSSRVPLDGASIGRGIQAELNLFKHALAQVETIARAGGGTELRIPGTLDHPTWMLAQKAFGFEPAPSAAATLPLLEEVARIGREEFPDQFRIDGPADMNHALGTLSEHSVDEAAREAYATYQRTGTPDDWSQVFRDSQGRDVLFVDSREDGDYWFLIHPETKRLLDWHELYLREGLVLRKKLRLRNGLVMLTPEEANRLAAEMAAAQSGGGRAALGRALVLPEDPNRPKGWTVARGDVSLTPEQLLPHDYLAQLKTRGMRPRVEIAPTRLDVPHEVAGFPPEGIPGFEIKILLGNGHALGRVKFGVDPADPTTVIMENMLVEGPDRKKTGDALRDRKGLPYDVLRHAMRQMEGILRLGGARRLRTTGAGNFVVQRLYERSGFHPVSREGKRALEAVDAAYAFARQPRPEGPPPMGPEEFSLALGTQHSEGPDETTRALWDRIKETKEIPANVRVLKNERGSPIMLVERRRDGKRISFIDTKDPAKRLLDWVVLHQAGQLFLEKDLTEP